MTKATAYAAREANASGYIEYPDNEHQIWQRLFERQIENLPGRACQEYMAGLDALALSKERIPQLNEIDQVLMQTTGWQTAPVPALISFGKFFELLASQKFPVATFIRSEQEFDYLQEPDIFHEIFGHCPLLTNQAFANFSQKYGQLGLAASKEDRVFLARLYWFTVEFGLLRNQFSAQEPSKLQIYGGGILSSPGETLYCMGTQPDIREFNIVDVLRTPYRIDIMQPVYYAIDSVDYLDEIASMDIMAAVSQAKSLGLFQPLFDNQAS